jgi:hypothetical protein
MAVAPPQPAQDVVQRGDVRRRRTVTPTPVGAPPNTHFQSSCQLRAFSAQRVGPAGTIKVSPATPTGPADPQLAFPDTLAVDGGEQGHPPGIDHCHAVVPTVRAVRPVPRFGARGPCRWWRRAATRESHSETATRLPRHRARAGCVERVAPHHVAPVDRACLDLGVRWRRRCTIGRDRASCVFSSCTHSVSPESRLSACSSPETSGTTTVLPARTAGARKGRQGGWRSRHFRGQQKRRSLRRRVLLATALRGQRMLDTRRARRRRCQDQDESCPRADEVISRRPADKAAICWAWVRHHHL